MIFGPRILLGICVGESIHCLQSVIVTNALDSFHLTMHEAGLS
jgi:hypothetical protein